MLVVTAARTRNSKNPLTPLGPQVDLVVRDLLDRLLQNCNISHVRLGDQSSNFGQIFLHGWNVPLNGSKLIQDASHLGPPERAVVDSETDLR